MNNRKVIALSAILTAAMGTAAFGQATISADFSAVKTDVSPNLYGIFFEDINYSADGGIYGEMVRNRSFELSRTDGWKIQTIKGKAAKKTKFRVKKDDPLNSNNLLHGHLEAKSAGDGIVNSGLRGMYFEEEKKYPGSVYLRSKDGSVKSVTVTAGDGKKVFETKIDGIGKEWKKYEFTVVPVKTTENGSLGLFVDQAGELDVDFVSLFRADIYKNEPNGLRKDLAERLEALHPSFVRFPGGCIVHGHKLADRYQWKNSVGPVEARKETPNFWGYTQTMGLGFYEYFRFCEDIGAEPLPVMSVGMSHDGERDPDYAWYANDILDMIEWATGPADSKWGKVRADAGHPEPFKLTYVGIGNEDCGADYLDRFLYISSKVKAKYPAIKTIISSGFTYNDVNFHNAWNRVREWQKNKKTAEITDLIDEHYYNPAEWFLSNTSRYDDTKFYPRGSDQPKVFVGEYAAWDSGRHNSLYAALCEAAYMTSLERNGDIVELASYAPLFARDGMVQWFPDAIWFNDKSSYVTPNYYVQQMYAMNKSDKSVKTTVNQPKSNIPKKFIAGTVGLGSWATTAEFKDVKLTNNDSGSVVWSSSGIKKDAVDTDFNNITAAGDWSVNTSSASIIQSSTATPSFMSLDNEDEMTGVKNYTLELKAKKTGGDEGFLISFGVKGKDLYWWNMGGWGNTQSCVEKGTLQGRSIISDSRQMTLETGKWYDIKIEVKGESFYCYLNGELIHSFTDAMNFDPIFAHVGEKGNKVIVKIVNVSEKAQDITINLNGVKVASEGKATVLAGSYTDENSFRTPEQVAPKTVAVKNAGPTFNYKVSAASLTIIELDKQ